MEWFSAPDYWLTRTVLERGLGVVYLFAFLTAVNQFPALLGERGLMPAPRFLRSVDFRRAPSLFQFHYTDRFLLVVAWIGVGLSVAVIAGLPGLVPQPFALPISMLIWFVLWVLYLSIVNIGQTFYSFGWESLLLEAGFLAIFLSDDRTAPPWLVLLMFRWLAFRVEFGAGLIKLRGDPCWRRLTCLDYHHETQPMPNPFSWYFHHLPRRLHRVEVLGNWVAQLVAPIGLFLPQPIAAICGLIMIGTQGYLMISGNYAWLNAITIVISLAAIPDEAWRFVLPISTQALTDPPIWFVGLVLGVAALVVVLSYWPVRNLIGRRQLMNYSFNQLHIVNAYGAFGSVTRDRYEIVVEGTAEELPTAGDWREYEFKGKPTDPKRRPPQVAPYHLRLDWLMWFAALSPAYANGWFLPFAQRLLEGDRATRALIRHDPFDGARPVWIRARLYLYRFTTWRERRETGAWWSRSLAGEFLQPVRLEPRDGAGLRLASEAA
jgi:lipase maturation factor